MIKPKGGGLVDFARASSGLAGLDEILDGLRWGDNVVWQVDYIKDYRHFVRPFVLEARRTDRRLVYFRFGQAHALIAPGKDVKVYDLDPGLGFEHFSTEIREIVAREGEGVCYVFDALSELLSEWSNDLMIGNFFLVTCPYLFEIKTIAYFALLRGRHSYQTVARIRETTQLLLDVYHHDRFYVHPLKVWKRYSPTMFLPHAAEGERFVPLTNSADAARLFSVQPQRSLGERKLDYWDHMFLRAANVAEEVAHGDRTLADEEQAIFTQLLRMLISRDQSITALAGKYLSMDDLLQIKARLIGSGCIGGKSVGLLLARAILAADGRPEWAHLLEPHDSFYVGADVYYTYLVENGCWELRQEQKKEESYFAAARSLQEKILAGVFPDMIRGQFLEMLEYFGQSPIIVRSSSLLEDGFGNAFAGKYESVFCANQGDLHERYERFIQAVRRVYASTMNEDALAYRLQRGLAQSDEQMALLVQRVSGSHRGPYFFPDLAGVALSHNLYTWREDMDPRAGMIRLVMGLGTRAVDRVEDDYARCVALDHPLLRPEADPEEQKAHTQRGVDLLDLGGNLKTSREFAELVRAGYVNHLPLLAVRDRREDADGGAEPGWILTFDRLLGQTDLVQNLRGMLSVLRTAYGHPVDIEFTVNFHAERGYSLNILQCRPLQVRGNRARIRPPHQIPQDRIIISARGRFMGSNLELKVGWIVYISPPGYAALGMSDKYEVARVVGRLNRLIPSKSDAPVVLLGPGRWGTSTPSLGVPVSFAEINHMSVLGEIAFETAGFIPEISYGTHFFHDLVETGISYLALSEGRDGTVIDQSFMMEAPNRLAELSPEDRRWEDVVHVVSGEENGGIWLYADVARQQVLCWRR